MTTAYDELIDWMASGFTPEDLVAYQPSPAARDRVEDLIYREKTSGLTAEETSELEHYMHPEHLIRLAKARAGHRLASCVSRASASHCGSRGLFGQSTAVSIAS